MEIKYVDGFKIRNTIDIDFGVIGSNKIFSYIPRGEIWFDKHYIKEKEHFLKVHLYELKLMEKIGYERARKIIEKTFIEKTDNIPNYVVRTRKYKGFLVKYVDGRIIRKYIDPKFILGMHGVLERGYYKIVGKNTIWIDIRQNKKEYKYTLLHEYTEARLMLKWRHKHDLVKCYNNAHDIALAAEKVARRNDGYARYLRD
ncbi:MAG: hypothetical protein ACP5OG_02755 [Candidatus Nanoarchaeia archaeon]